ncbi:hypothetical protein OG524_29490 [Streptomyces sp. NBC_01520]|uniref:hypothetical protein n=1 Tax=Streptomyces sp. NBC_01520 TaxID=2903892 RepID=UPI00386BA139
MTTAAVAPVLLVAALTSCSNDETKAAPEIPERICWGAFAGDDVTPLLGTGDEATLRTDPAFELPKDRDKVSCSLSIDGNPGFSASADLWDYEKNIDWTTYEQEGTSRLDVGDKGRIWPSGSATYFECESPKSPSGPGRYVALSLFVHDSPDQKKVRRALPKLLKQFMTFAQRELDCR